METNLRSMGIPINDDILISDISTFSTEMQQWDINMLTEKDFLDMIFYRASRPWHIYEEDVEEDAWM